MVAFCVVAAHCTRQFWQLHNHNTQTEAKEKHQIREHRKNTQIIQSFLNLFGAQKNTVFFAILIILLQL